MNSEEKLINAFVAGLGIEASTTDWENLKYREIPEWDSVAHMQVIAEIEDQFDIMLEIEDVIAMSSYPTARELVAKYGISF
jgi:acyl carrier protein